MSTAVARQGGRRDLPPSALTGRSLPRAVDRDAGQSPVAGLMFWFERNRLSGSYLALIRTRRAYNSAP
jgi:hypothetical protein